jgi:hypothetical protein
VRKGASYSRNYLRGNTKLPNRVTPIAIKPNMNNYAHDHVWNLLKFLFIESGETVNKEVLKELLGTTTENDERLVGKRDRDTLNIPDLYHRVLYHDASTTVKKEEISDEVMNTHVRKIRDELHRVRGIMLTEPAPAACSFWEDTCAVVRITISNDNWYPLEEKTKKRGCFMEIMFILFLLQVHYRYWRRISCIRDKPLDTDTDVGQIWGNCLDFIGNGWFPVLQDEDKLAPIKEWGPVKVLRAMNTLMRGRQMGKTDFSTLAACFTFNDYRTALFDRVCEIVIFPLNGSPTELSETRGNTWFRLKTTAEMKETINIGQQGDIHAIAKDIKKKQLEELEKKQKTLLAQGETIKVTAIPKEVRWSKMEKAQEETRIKDLQRTLFQKQAYLDALKEDSNIGDEINEYDRKLEQELKTDILDIQERLQSIKLENESNERLESSKKLAMALKLSEKTTANIQYQSEPKLKFLQELMILYDHIHCWSLNAGVEKFRAFTDKNIKLKEIFRSEITKTIALTTESSFLSQCQKWIIGRDILFPEREAYRVNYSSSFQFTSLDVCGFRRSLEETHFDDFPSDVTQLLQNKENPYYYRAWAYFVWWFLLQISFRRFYLLLGYRRIHQLLTKTQPR